MKKRLLTLLTTVAVLTGVIAGCGNEETDNSSSFPNAQDELLDDAADKGASQERPSDAEISVNDDFNKTLIGLIEESGFSDQNYMISPTSFRAALALAVTGADGETKEQLFKAMGFGSMEGAKAWYQSVTDSIDDFDEYLENAKKDFEEYKEYYGEDAEAPDGAFKMQNSIWRSTKASGRLSDDYISRVADSFGAVADNASPDEITDKVNNWINEGTGGLIPSISNDLSYADLILVNTLYLRSAWMNDFYEGATSEGDFHTLNGQSVKKYFMHQQDRFLYYEDDGGKLVVLPMNGGINAVFVLGDIDDATSRVKESSYEEVAVALPKFETETSLSDGELINYLKYMGAELAFTDDADFSLMSDEMSMCISDIIQKTKIKVDEKGMEAAAATAIMMTETAALEEPEVKEFTADEPFKYMIMTTGENPELLFYGQIVD